MLQVLGWALLAIVVAGGLCGLAVVFLPAGEQIAPAVRDEPIWQLPHDRDLRAEDVDSVRLPVALRGYRFAETDLLLDRLAEEIRARDVTIARLTGAGAASYAPLDEAPTDDVLLDDGPVVPAGPTDATEPETTAEAADAAEPESATPTRVDAEQEPPGGGGD